MIKHINKLTYRVSNLEIRCFWPLNKSRRSCETVDFDKSGLNIQKRYR